MALTTENTNQRTNTSPGPGNDAAPESTDPSDTTPSGAEAAPASKDAGEPEKPDDMQTAIRQIWERAKPDTMARVAVIERAAEALLTNELDDTLRDRAQSQAHRLAGSLGMFGYAEASTIARRLEHLFESGGPYEQDEIVTACDDAVALRNALEAPPNVDETPATATAGTILFIAKERTILKRIRGRLSALGLDVTTVAGLDALRPDKHLHNPGGQAASLAVCDLGPDPLGEADWARIRQVAEEMPVIALAPDMETQPRIRAARAGVRRFLMRDASPEYIVKAVQALHHPVGQSPIRTYIVGAPPGDDLVASLDAPNLKTKVFADSAEFLFALESGRPELVVVDVDNQPDEARCHGHLVRMDPRFSDIPLAVIASTDNADAFTLVTELEADALIARPLPANLSRRLEVEVQRHRAAAHPARQQSPRTESNAPDAAEGPPPLRTLLESAGRNGREVVLFVVGVPRATEGSGSGGSGRDAPDQAATDVAKTIQKALGPEDLVVPHGAEGHLVAWYGLSPERASERMRDVLETLDADASGPPETCAGGALYPEHGTAVQPLIEQAARMLETCAPDDPVKIAPTRAEQGIETVDVLLVDDDETLASLLQHALASRGHRIKWIADGVDAKKALLSDPPAVHARVVLLDVNLPSMDGLTLLRHCRDAGLLASTKVIMLTARVREAEVVEALGLGASDHVGKPFSVPVLTERIRHVLEG